MKMIKPSIRPSIILIVFSSFFFHGCKKNVDKPPTPLTGSYILATLDGTDHWQSITAGGINTLDTLGIGGMASDGSYIYIYFSDASLNVVGVNNPFAPLSLDYKYIIGQDDVFSSTNPGGAASVTLTRYDQTNKWIEGTFTGTAIHISANGSQTTPITDGKFAINYQ
jgi:hypothetical protein